MVKIKEYYQVGNREDITREGLLVLLEDMYKDLAAANNEGEATNIKAWCTFDGEGANGSKTITGQSNISDVTKTGTGTYTLTFDEELDDNTYAVIVTGVASHGVEYNMGGVHSKATTNTVIETFYFDVTAVNNMPVDSPDINVIIVGN